MPTSLQVSRKLDQTNKQRPSPTNILLRATNSENNFSRPVFNEVSATGEGKTIWMNKTMVEQKHENYLRFETELVLLSCVATECGLPGNKHFRGTYSSIFTSIHPKPTRHAASRNKDLGRKMFNLCSTMWHDSLLKNERLLQITASFT
jgi:hypothetical protein